MKYENKEPKPVEKIEVNEKNVKLRFFFFILSIIIVIVCAILIFVSTVKKDDGWNQVYSSSTIAENCGDELVFNYNLGKTKESNTSEYKKVAALYTESLEKIYTLLDTYEEYEGIKNVYYINNHINEEIEVEPALYNSLEKVIKENSRMLYLAPINSYYDNLILSDNDEAASFFDPYRNENTKKLFEELLVFIKNDEHVSLSLLGNNKIKLNVSAEYSDYMKENEIDKFIDFSWIRNAFIIDYVCNQLIENNYTNGYISSYDGFFVNLASNINYKINLLESIDDIPEQIASFVTNEPLSGVQLRNYIYYTFDILNCYEYENGDSRHFFIDIEDGLCKTSLSTLTAYSYSTSCVDIALAISDVYINSSFDQSNLLSINKSIEYIWTSGNKLYHTAEELNQIKYYGSGINKYEEVYIS